jgi:hypothetical protein
MVEVENEPVRKVESHGQMMGYSAILNKIVLMQHHLGVGV